VVHDSGRGGENNVTELTRREKLHNPLLEVGELDVVARGDDTGLVDAMWSSGIVFVAKKETWLSVPAVELDDNLAVAVVINLLELADVA